MNAAIKEHAILLAFGVPTVIGIAASSVLLPDWHGYLLGSAIAATGLAGAVFTARRVG